MSNRVMPRSSALWITARVASSSMRAPKLLQPRPMAETRRPDWPRLRSSIGGGSLCRAAHAMAKLGKCGRWRQRVAPRPARHAGPGMTGPVIVRTALACAAGVPQPAPRCNDVHRFGGLFLLCPGYGGRRRAQAAKRRGARSPRTPHAHGRIEPHPQPARQAAAGTRLSWNLHQTAIEASQPAPRVGRAAQPAPSGGIEETRDEIQDHGAGHCTGRLWLRRAGADPDHRRGLHLRRADLRQMGRGGAAARPASS